MARFQMASRLAEAHIEAERRLRLAATTGTEHIWRSLPSYDEANVGEWLSGVIPLVRAAQHRSVSLTDAYLARAMRRRPLGIDPDEVISSLRGGVPPEEVYHRPFVTVWSALGVNTLYEDAVAAGLARATSTAAMDVQLAMVHTAAAVGEADPRIQRFQRVADGGACAFCQEVDGAVLNSADAMPLHNNCGCGIEPLEDAQPVTPTPEGVAVHEHGELGSLLGDPSHDFTTESQALG